MLKCEGVIKMPDHWTKPCEFPSETQGRPLPLDDNEIAPDPRRMFTKAQLDLRVESIAAPDDFMGQQAGGPRFTSFVQND